MRDESAQRVMRKDPEGKDYVNYQCEHCRKYFFTPAKLTGKYYIISLESLFFSGFFPCLFNTKRGWNE